MFNTAWKAMKDLFTSDFPIHVPYKIEPYAVSYEHIEEDWIDEMSLKYMAYEHHTTEQHIEHILRELGYDITSDYPRDITLPRDRSKYPILSCC